MTSPFHSPSALEPSRGCFRTSSVAVVLACSVGACGAAKTVPTPVDSTPPTAPLDSCSVDHKVFTAPRTALRIRWEFGETYTLWPNGELESSGIIVGKFEPNGRVLGTDGELELCWTPDGMLLDSEQEPAATTLRGNRVQWTSDMAPDANDPITVTVIATGNKLTVVSSRPAVPHKYASIESGEPLDDDARHLALLIVLLPDYLGRSQSPGIE